MPFATENKISQDPIENGIEISDEQYAEGLQGLMNGLRITIDGGFAVLPIVIAVEPEVVNPTLDELKLNRLRELNELGQQLADQVTLGYPEFEKLTWEDQRRESVAWAANNSIATPYIDALAGYRGIGRVDYLNRTLIKINALKAWSSRAVGLRQKYVDLIASATTEAQLAAIEFNFA